MGMVEEEDEEAHMVDLSGDWWGGSVVGGAGGGSWFELAAGWGLEGECVRCNSAGGGTSGSVKSVCRESSQRTTEGGLDGPWCGRAWAMWPGSRRERKAREPREQNV